MKLTNNRVMTRQLIIVFILALAIRGVYLIESSDNPTFRLPIVDSRTYDQLAREIAREGALTLDVFWQPPFYPLFLSSLYRFTGGSILYVKIFQMILGALTCLLVTLLAAKIFNGTVGFLAGMITAVYPPLIFYEGELMASGWAAFWAVCLILLLIQAAEKSSSWHYLLLGLAGALSLITRPVFLPFLIVSSIWLTVTVYRQGSVKKSAAKVTIMAAGFMVIAILTGLLGYHTTGKVRILPFSGGINFYIGNNPNFKDTIAIRPGIAWQKFMELPAKHGIENIYEKEKFFRNRAIDYILAQPINFMNGLAYKTTQFFSSREIPRNIDIYSFRKWSWLLRFGVWKLNGFGFPFGLLISLALVGAIYFYSRIPVPIWLFLAFYSASVILIFVASRYRAPVLPILCLLAAAGVASLWEISKKGQWKKLALFISILVLAGSASSIFGPFYIERLDYDAELQYSLGVALEKKGQLEKAKEAYHEAVRLNPDLADA